MEIEAKYALQQRTGAEQIEAIDWSPFTLGPRSSIDQHDTFFDTPNRLLSRARHAVRLREGGVQAVVTLKGPGQVTAGIHRREEIEEPTGDPQPAGWPQAIRTRLHELIQAEVMSQLQPLLSVRNKRRIWPLLHENQPIGEVALDEGTIEANGRSIPMHELEIELKGGQPSDLEIVGAIVQRQLPAQPEDRSKFERGFALLSGQ